MSDWVKWLWQEKNSQSGLLKKMLLNNCSSEENKTIMCWVMYCNNCWEMFNFIMWFSNWEFAALKYSPFSVSQTANGKKEKLHLTIKIPNCHWLSSGWVQAIRVGGAADLLQILQVLSARKTKYWEKSKSLEWVDDKLRNSGLTPGNRPLEGGMHREHVSLQQRGES